MLTRALSRFTCAVLVLLSPGLAPYEALAARGQGRTSGSSCARFTPVPTQTLLIKGPAIGVNLLPAGIKVALPEVEGAVETPAASVPPARSEMLPSDLTAGPQTLRAASASAAAVLEAAGDIARAEPGRAFSSGHDLQNALTGVRLLRYSNGAYEPAGDFFGAFPAGGDAPGLVQGRAAGDESIRPAVEANYRGPSDPAGAGGGNQNERGGSRDAGRGGYPASLLSWPARLAGSAAGLLSAYFIGLPLFAYRPLLGGAYVAAAGLLGLMPLMPRGRFPGLLRGLPALALLTAGLAATGSGVSLLYGPLAFFCALGLSSAVSRKETGARYALTVAAALAVVAGLGMDLAGEFWWSEPITRQDLTLGNAVALAGLALSPVLLYRQAAAAWKGVLAGLSGVLYDIKAAAKVFFVLADAKRLEFGANVSAWFAFWSGRSLAHWSWLWAPGAVVLAAGLAYAALTAAVGLFLGALHFLPLALWGFAHAASPASRWTRFWAGFARSLMTTQSSSDSWFRWFVAPLKPWLDARAAAGPAPRAFAALVPFALAQLLWLATVALSTTVWVGVAAWLGAPRHVAGLLALPAIFYLGKAFMDGARNAWGPKAFLKK